ncbi:MAG: hypothetical protein AB1547_04940 [Thermodesulfobacteriota bacterium]
MDALSDDHGVVMYEGQAYALKDLMLKLQDEVRQMADRLTRMASLLGELHRTLESTRTIEVKLSLSREEYERFKSLQGDDDRERILQAIRNATVPGVKVPGKPPEARIEPIVASLATPKTGPLNEMKGPVQALVEELSVSVAAPDEPHPPISSPVRKKPSAKCPRCGDQLMIPDLDVSRLPMEVKCSNCGAKCMVKSRANAGKPEKTTFDTTEDSTFGNIFDMLST